MGSKEAGVMDAGGLDRDLRRFRSSHQVVRRELAGQGWSYFACGRGAATLLLLPGAPGIAEMAFPYLLAFEPRYRVLAPSYPPGLGQLDQILSGLIGLLRAEANGPVHLIGASYSGLIAQYLLAACPAHVASLLIGDTGVPQIARAYRHRALRAAIGRLPRLGLHALLFTTLAGVLRGTSERHRFWQRYMRAVVATTTRAEIANRLGVMIEMDQRGHELGPLGGWRGPTLLIETADDPLFAPAERAALRARFAHAERHTFYNQGHTTALTRFDEYIALMQDFLARQ
jgi:aminoacrylate hydrolase